MSAIRFAEFRNSLENTKYPFIPTATLTNNSVAFLEGTFLDAHIYAISGTGGYYISSAVVTQNNITIYLSDSQNQNFISGTITLPVTDSNVQLLDIYGRPSGILVSEPTRLSILSTWGLGTHTFQKEQTEFCITCQIPISDPGVTGFVLPSGEILTGRVWFVGEDGVVLSNNGSQIQINVIGDPLYLQRLCDPQNLFNPVRPIRVIRVVNGSYTYDCTPDDTGNFNLQMNDSITSDTALRIRTNSSGIVFNIEGSTTR